MANRSARSWAVLVAIAALAAACASERPAQRPVNDQPLPRSSIAALIEHRAELVLTADQVTRLTAVDEKLHQANAQLRTSAEAQLRASAAALPQGPGAGTATNRVQRERVPRGGRICTVCSTKQCRPEDAIDDPRIRVRLQQLVDDNDEKAFASIEPLLDDGQRAIARAIVARYRE